MRDHPEAAISKRVAKTCGYKLRRHNPHTGTHQYLPSAFMPVLQGVTVPWRGQTVLAAFLTALRAATQLVAQRHQVNAWASQEKVCQCQHVRQAALLRRHHSRAHAHGVQDVRQLKALLLHPGHQRRHQLGHHIQAVVG